MADERNDSQDLPACLTAYITAMLKKMGYRRKVREDVRAEITAHFEDELRDCTTEKEKEQKAGQLIGEFGDLKLLGILLRRAKIRCRPLWRTLVARTFQGIGILLLCVVLYGIWFCCGQPTIRVDYIALLNRINQPQVRNENNAWPYYEKAISLYVPKSPLVEQFISYRRSGGRDHEEAIWLKKTLRDNEKRVQAWLDENQKYWDNLTAEQQRVLFKCFEYDWVPFLKTAYQTHTEWQVTPFHRMVEHIIRCIKDDVELTMPHPRGSLPRSMRPGFPSAELKRWLQDHTIPPNELEAVSVAVLHEAIKRFKNFPEDESAPLTDVECESIGPWIAQNEPAWREFQTASRKGYCYRPYEHQEQERSQWAQWGVALPHLSPLRELAMFGIWRSRLDRSGGRIQQGIEDCLTVARAAGHWNDKATLLEQLVAQSISRIANNEILHIVNRQSLSAAEIEQLQRQLSQIYPGGYPLLNVEGERLALLNIIQRSFTEGGPGGGHLIPAQWIDFSGSIPSDMDANARRLILPLYTAMSMAHAGRDATIAKVNEIFDLQSKIAGMTPYERHIAEITTVDEMMVDSLPSARFFLIHLFSPASERTSEIVYWNKTLHEATITILALKQWRLEKSTYPAALWELVAAGLLKELPMDPYSDKPLMYKKTDDDFILYSVGPNYTDDAGQYSKDRYGHVRNWIDNGDTIFWPLSE